MQLDSWSCGSGKRGFFLTQAPNWTEAATGSLRIPHSGLYRIHWRLWAEATKPGWFWNRATEEFALRLEVGGKYAYVYAPPAKFENSGYVSLDLREGVAECYLLVRSIQRSLVEIRNLRVELCCLENAYGEYAEIGPRRA